MQEKDIAGFHELCDTAKLTLEEYTAQRSPFAWLQRVWKTKHINHTKTEELQVLLRSIDAIDRSIKTDDDLHQKQNQLIGLLDDVRGQLSIHTDSQFLREKVQDALRDVIRVSMHLPEKEHTFLQDKIIKHQEHTKEDKFYTRGDFLVSGLLIEWFGTHGILLRTLNKIKFELETLQKNNVENGYLNSTAIKNYLSDIRENTNAINKEEFDKEALLQHVRYIIEDVQNAAGVLPGDKAKYKKHQGLINSLFWHDEMLRLAQARLAVKSQL